MSKPDADITHNATDPWTLYIKKQVTNYKLWKHSQG